MTKPVVENEKVQKLGKNLHKQMLEEGASYYGGIASKKDREIERRQRELQKEHQDFMATKIKSNTE